MNVYTMPGVADMGMVWMGASSTNQDLSMGLVANDSGDLMLDHDNPYFTPSHNSASNQSLEDMGNVHDSPMGMEGMDLLPYSDFKQESSDGSYLEDDSSPPTYITTSTQTSSPTRKIKPIKHPGLVLKTPIAYQSNTDPSVIPIQKDGIAICEKCGAIGVKHAFYTKERRFCSMACARGYNGLMPEPLMQQMDTGMQTVPQNSLQPSPYVKHFMEHKFKMEIEEDYTGLLADQPFPQLPPPPHNTSTDDGILLSRRNMTEIANSYDWDSQLNDPNFVAAPVTCFKHAPISDIWSNILVGMKVEVENTDCDNMSEAFPDSFWVASVLKIIGYKALLRYEGFGSNETKDFWVSLCSNQVHPVGWCATRGKPLIPPKTIEDKYSDWKEFLCKRLTGARTLPSTFSAKVTDSMKSRFHCGLNLEVVDKNYISQVKVAVVHKIIGKRLNVRYYDSPDEDSGFWCHEDSPLLHPVGWAKRVGHNLEAPSHYLERVNEGMWDDDDALNDLFNPIQIGSNNNSTSNKFCVGMKVEAIDPLNLSAICLATVMKVLQCGYIMVQIDQYESESTDVNLTQNNLVNFPFEGRDWFCYHVTSPCIFPVGFCERNDISIMPPKGYTPATFKWDVYLKKTNSVAVDSSLFNTHVYVNTFMEGMKLEAADLMDPRLVCVATVSRIVGRLLKVRFDGWEEEYDQWLDCENSDIYPVGWCHSVGYKLEGPGPGNKYTTPVTKLPKIPKKRGRKKKIKDVPVKLSAHSDKMDNGDLNELLDFELRMPEENEPETAQEPLGPEQSMPIASSDPQPPAERKATSYINTHEMVNTKIIPRLIDNSGGFGEKGNICPEEWNVFDVAQFLRVNDWVNYCDVFSKQKIDGKILLGLSKDDIVEVMGGKVGPSLKIYDLIQQLKLKANAAQMRHMKTNKRNFL